MFRVIFLILLTQKLATKGELIDRPSLTPEDPFNMEADAQRIKDEIYGDSHTNRDVIAHIIFRRTLDQREKLNYYYSMKYFKYRNKKGEEVVSNTLERELFFISSDNLQKLYTLMFTKFEAQLSNTLHLAIHGEWKEGGVVEEIVCANDKKMKDLIQAFYKEVFKCTVEDDLKSIHPDDQYYQNAVHKHCWPERCQEKKLKPEDIDKEAKALRDINAKEDKDGFKIKLKEMLDKHCEPDLKQIFDKYKHDDYRISDGVDEAFEGDEKTAYNVLARYIENTGMFYADELYHAVKGAGTDNDKINRIVVTRSERDMAYILDEYKTKRGETFTKRLKTDVIMEPRYLKSIRYLCGDT